jgi:cytoskeletal protein RodZ
MALSSNAYLDLPTVRRKKGVSLAEISNDTKIRVHYLQAIETGAFGELPGGIYAVSYIRQYARAIDYNESELVEYYYQVTGLTPESTPPPPPPPTRRSLSDWLRVLGTGRAGLSL